MIYILFPPFFLTVPAWTESMKFSTRVSNAFIKREREKNNRREIFDAFIRLLVKKNQQRNFEVMSPANLNKIFIPM